MRSVEQTNKQTNEYWHSEKQTKNNEIITEKTTAARRREGKNYEKIATAATEMQFIELNIIVRSFCFCIL